MVSLGAIVITRGVFVFILKFGAFWPLRDQIYEKTSRLFDSCLRTFLVFGCVVTYFLIRSQIRAVAQRHCSNQLSDQKGRGIMHMRPKTVLNCFVDGRSRTGPVHFALGGHMTDLAGKEVRQ